MVAPPMSAASAAALWAEQCLFTEHRSGTECTLLLLLLMQLQEQQLLTMLLLLLLLLLLPNKNPVGCQNPAV